ncbi:hypothetical protein BAUCODRAFT_70890 [Lecanosticta acicola]|uniref:Zn(2)-C6 fungal-type domain-containing protein n=1 Tax=Lecanosticta acicola TaxID=111012 RepID=A0AAI8Z9P4_9PEZI|nr:hypothetical protein BAUCODRAFT_70890 [Lecanosticta acicola]
MITSPTSPTLLRCSPSLSAFTNYSPFDSSPEVNHDSADAVVTPDSEHESPPERDSPVCGSVVPKIEELDDDDDDDHNALEALAIDAKPALGDDQAQAQPLPAPPPRKRGRPRKHPIVEQKKSTASHARSKTGCGTCRRRKKKCDETKPVCLNCEKNNVVCDGYEPKQPWRSGKQKALVKCDPTPLPPLQIIPEGVEGAVDRMFVQHFTSLVGRRLSLTDNGNPFLEHIFQMAQKHVGLMHGLIYLSGSNLIAGSPYSNAEWEERQWHHESKAINFLWADLKKIIDASDQNKALVSVDDHSLAQSLVLCLQTVAAGNTNGIYRTHLDALKKMLECKSGALNNITFRRFVLEFVIYHDYSSAITSLQNPLDERSFALMEEFRLSECMIQPQAGILLGVLDGLFGYISQIRSLRDIIRGWAQQGTPFWASPQAGYIQEQVFNLTQAIRKWKPDCQPDSPRFEASLLYRQCTYIYLARTASPSRPLPFYQQAVEEGLKHLRNLPWDKDKISTQSILLMPLFLLGCAAFDPQQRPEIDDAFQRLQDWSNFGNIKHTRSVIQELWHMMDNDRAEETWDWETIMDRQQLRFLIT